MNRCGEDLKKNWGKGLMREKGERGRFFLIWRGIRGEEGICIFICIYIFVCIQGGRRKGGVWIWHGMRGRRSWTPAAPILGPTLATRPHNSGHQQQLWPPTTLATTSNSDHYQERKIGHQYKLLSKGTIDTIYITFWLPAERSNCSQAGFL